MKKLLAFVIGLLVFGHVYNMYAGSYDEASDIKKRAEARANENYETAIFAGGCFWCMQPPFDKLPGVITTIAGYSGGPEENPTYKQVSYGKTGHAESVEIIYVPTQITYYYLLDVYWRNIDPTDSEGQFADR